MSDIYKVIVKKDNDGEFYIDLPDELMKSLDWKIGDELVWEETEVLGEEAEYPAAYVCKKIDDDKIKKTLNNDDPYCYKMDCGNKVNILNEFCDIHKEKE